MLLCVQCQEALNIICIYLGLIIMDGCIYMSILSNVSSICVDLVCPNTFHQLSVIYWCLSIIVINRLVSSDIEIIAVYSFLFFLSLKFT